MLSTICTHFLNAKHRKCTCQKVVLLTLCVLCCLGVSAADGITKNKVHNNPHVSSTRTNLPLQCKASKGGFDYAGYQNKTRTGKVCQTWVMKTPNTHDYVMENFPDKSLLAAGYYCRNPNKDPHGPWCYLNDSKGSEYCDVPYCEGNRRECREDRVGLEYRGTMSKTMSGHTCQRWDAQTPHKHIYKDFKQFPENSLSAVQNYCRNPDGETDGPWCFTTNFTRGWELCPIPYCHINECKKSYNATEYAGKTQHTHTGKKCQRWDSQYPHPHDYIKNSLFPDATVSLAENYCRNPDPHKMPFGPWCFVTDIDDKDGGNRSTSEYCSVPLCDKNFEHWTGIFENHPKWSGHYLFNNKWTSFNFTVKGVKFPWEDSRGGVLIGLFDDGSSSFDMEGWVNEEHIFKFRQTKRYQVKEWFMHGYYVNGHLLYNQNNQTWQFVAIPLRGMMAINEFKMSPIDHLIIGIGHRPAQEATPPNNSAGIAVGVTLGIIVLAVIIVLGVICIRKKGLNNYKRYLVFHNPSGSATAEDAERL